MQRVLGKLARRILQDENEKIKFAKFVQMRDHDGWKTFLEWLMYLRASIAEELLSDKFSKLEPYEKDVQQRAFNMVDHLILFLVDYHEFFETMILTEDETS